MIAVLSKLLGLQNLDTANDIVQDSLLQAMNTWSFKGIPENPPAWLYRVAKNKAIDFLRQPEFFKISEFDDKRVEPSMERHIGRPFKAQKLV